MSAGSVATQDRYRVVRIITRTPFRFTLVDYAPEFSVRIDQFRSEASAHYSARILNEGRASIDVHAPVGCKVVAS